LTESEKACDHAKLDLTDENAALEKKLQECESTTSGLKKDLDETTINS